MNTKLELISEKELLKKVGEGVSKKVAWQKPLLLLTKNDDDYIYITDLLHETYRGRGIGNDPDYHEFVRVDNKLEISLNGVIIDYHHSDVDFYEYLGSYLAYDEKIHRYCVSLFEYEAKPVISFICVTSKNCAVEDIPEWMEKEFEIAMLEKKSKLFSAFANAKLEEYKSWWGEYKNEFLGHSVIVKEKNCPLLQREYVAQSRLKICGCQRASIPCVEITPLYREAKDGLLFVNCNPSGTDYPYYQKCNGTSLEDVLCYDKPDNTYFKAVEEFAEKIGGKGFGNYAMIDVFPIVMQNQAVLKKAYGDAKGRLKDAFDELIESFLDLIIQIEPKVVIVTNAFVKDLFVNKFNGRIRVKHDEKDVCYHLGIKKFETTVFCGGMIAGGHQMDTESKKRLIRDVALFMK